MEKFRALKRFLGLSRVCKSHGMVMKISSPERISVLGVNLDRVDEVDVNNFIGGAIKFKNQVWVGNLNVHAVNLAFDSESLRNVFNSAELVFCDGQGLSLILKLLGFGTFPQVTYNRWMPNLLEYCARQGYSLFFLGSEQVVIEEAMAKANAAYPGLVVGCHHGFFGPDEADAVVDAINIAGAAILLVGMGMPRQEQFIHDNRDRLVVNVLLNGGGCFMFYTGRHPISPIWMSRIG